MANRGHLLQNGFEKILGLRANLNLGISEKLKQSFPNIVPVPRPEIATQSNIDPN